MKKSIFTVLWTGDPVEKTSNNKLQPPTIPFMKPRKLIPLLGSSVIFFSASAHAGDVIKANNTTALNVAGSWTTAVPTATDVAVWNSTVVGANSSALGGDLAWQGIKITNPGGDVTIANASSANTLTLGSAGIDASTSTRKLQIQSKVTLAADQTWSPNSTAAPAIEFAAQVSGVPLNLGGFTLSIAGAGIVQPATGITISNGTINIGNGTTASVMALNSGSGRAVTVNSNVFINIAANSTLGFNVNSGTSGVVAEQSAAVVTNNGGTIRVQSTNTTQANQTGKVTSNNGSTIDNQFNNNTAATARFALSGELALFGTTTWKESGAGTTATIFSGPLTGNGTLNFQNTSTAVGRRLDVSGNNSAFTGAVNLNGTSGNRNLRLTTATAGSVQRL